MSEKTLKFGDVVVNKKEFQTSKKPIALNLVGIDNLKISAKFKHNISKHNLNIISLDLYALFCLK